MKHKIGDIVSINKEWFQCVEGLCKDCYFSENSHLCKQLITEDICTSHIIYKKLEKVGEQLKINGKIYQGLISPYGFNNCSMCAFRNISCKDVISCYDDYIFIEIKQNKEDMEECKMHDAKEDFPEFDKVVDECLFGDDKLILKPFDLEAAKAGKPVCTRGGRKARIICFDKRGGCPIIALVETFVVEYDCMREEAYYYTIDGREIGQNAESKDDLMMLPEKKEGCRPDCDDIKI